MRAPGLTTSIGGKNKTLYMQSVASIEEATRKNLKLTLAELGLVEGSEIVVEARETEMRGEIVKNISVYQKWHTISGVLKMGLLHSRKLKISFHKNCTIHLIFKVCT